MDAGTNIVPLETHSNTHACFIGGRSCEIGAAAHVRFKHVRIGVCAVAGAKVGFDARDDAGLYGAGDNTCVDAYRIDAFFPVNGGVGPENGVVVQSNSDERTHFRHDRVDAWAGAYTVDTGFADGDNVGVKDGANAGADAGS